MSLPAAIAVVLHALIGNAAFAQNQNAPASVVVEVAGKVPGFNDPQKLASLIASRMEVAIPTWRFVASPAGETPPANRVEWNFKPQKVTWGGGTHRGFQAPVIIRYSLDVEAKLTVNNRSGVVKVTQPTAAEEPDDAELAAIAAKVAQSIATWAKSG